MSGCDRVLEVEGLERNFEDVRAVDGISFHIERGQVLGFIGANGAGKTTTMRMVVTLEQPDRGHIRVCGLDVVENPSEVRRRVGWMPDAFGSYDNMSVQDYLDFYSRAFGYRGLERRKRVESVMEFTDLGSLADRPMNKLSKGMTQRLCLGRTLIHDPELLVLDEPAAGLDPKARIEFRNCIRLLAQQGKTIFISSHILSELGEMCDELLFIDAGRIVHHGNRESLTRRETAGVLVEVRVTENAEVVGQWAAMHPGVELVDITQGVVRLRFEDGSSEALAARLREMVMDGLPVCSFSVVEKKLEDAFVDLLKENGGRQP